MKKNIKKGNKSSEKVPRVKNIKRKMKKCKKYSLEEKLNYIELASKLGLHKTSSISGIDRKSLREWSKNKEKLEKIRNKQNKFRLPGGGAKPKTIGLEHHLIYFSLCCRKVGIKITSNLIINELLRISPENKNKSLGALRNWSYRFFKRSNINYQ